MIETASVCFPRIWSILGENMPIDRDASTVLPTRRAHLTDLARRIH
jgi:hypothetical protein